MIVATVTFDLEIDEDKFDGDEMSESWIREFVTLLINQGHINPEPALVNAWRSIGRPVMSDHDVTVIMGKRS